MSTDVWTFLNPGAPQSAHDFANLDHPCEGRRQTRRYDLTYQCDQASRLRNGQRTPGGGLITRAAELARSHSDTNVLCIGAKIIGSAIALEIVRVWMATEWLGEGEGGEKYARRVNEVKDIDARHLVPLD
jgi:hypothetical protein